MVKPNHPLLLHQWGHIPQNGETKNPLLLYDWHLILQNGKNKLSTVTTQVGSHSVEWLKQIIHCDYTSWFSFCRMVKNYPTILKQWVTFGRMILYSPLHTKNHSCLNMVSRKGSLLLWVTSIVYCTTDGPADSSPHPDYKQP